MNRHFYFLEKSVELFGEFPNCNNFIEFEGISSIKEESLLNWIKSKTKEKSFDYYETVDFLRFCILNDFYYTMKNYEDDVESNEIVGDRIICFLQNNLVLKDITERVIILNEVLSNDFPELTLVIETNSWRLSGIRLKKLLTALYKCNNNIEIASDNTGVFKVRFNKEYLSSLNEDDDNDLTENN